MVSGANAMLSDATVMWIKAREVFFFVDVLAFEHDL